jgi:hypothetical protein
VQKKSVWTRSVPARCHFHRDHSYDQLFQTRNIHQLFCTFKKIYFLMWPAPFGCLYYFYSFLPSSGPFYPYSFQTNSGIELTSKDHGSDCESSTITTRPGSFPSFSVPTFSVFWRKDIAEQTTLQMLTSEVDFIWFFLFYKLRNELRSKSVFYPRDIKPFHLENWIRAIQTKKRKLVKHFKCFAKKGNWKKFLTNCFL